MPMFGQTSLLLGSLVVGFVAISLLALILFYRLCVRSNRTSELLGRDISSIITELISAKTFGEQGNERLATNMLNHSTNWQNQAREPIHHPIVPPTEEALPRPEDQIIGPALSDIEILGEDDSMYVGGDEAPPENLE